MKRKQGLSLSQSENRSEWGLERAFCGAVWRGVMPHLGHRSYASMRKPNPVAVALQLRQTVDKPTHRKNAVFSNN